MIRDEECIKRIHEQLYKCPCGGADSCWIWTGAVNSKGYGAMWYAKKHMVAVHRIMYQLETNVDLTPEQFVLHKCDQPRCVRPSHMFIGDHAANAADMVGKGRQCCGEKASHAKLTEKQVKHILANPPSKYNKGKWVGAMKEMEEYAKPYGVSPTTISNILGGRSWKHIPRSADTDK